MLHEILHELLHAGEDTLTLLPLLFLTYLFMEYLEHRAGEKMNRLLQKTKKTGPLLGAALGLIPQCGFSGAAANLYASGTITVGTLLAVFASTSDEMLPIFISAKLSAAVILTLLVIKFISGLLLGFLADLLVRGKEHQSSASIHAFCEQEHCHCEEHIVVSALKHTVKIGLLIYAVTALLNIAFLFLPEEQIASLWRVPVLGVLLAALIGLIPNCSASVMLTNLYVNGVMGAAPLLAGLIANAGVGLVVLGRVNKKPKENLRIVLVLFAFGVVFGGVAGWAAESFLPYM